MDNPTQRAMQAARTVTLDKGRKPQPGDVSIDMAAAAFGASRTQVKEARYVLRHGTREEIAACDAGTLGVSRLAQKIRAGTAPAERKRERAAPVAQRGGHAERIARQKANAALYGRLRDAMENLTNLPRPVDMVEVIRTVGKAAVVDDKLVKSTLWLMEFEDVWNKREAGEADG